MYRTYTHIKSNETTNQENEFRKNAFPQVRWSIQSMELQLYKRRNMLMNTATVSSGPNWFSWRPPKKS